MATNLHYNGRGFYSGLTSENTRIYVAVELIEQHCIHALSNEIDLSIVLNPDSWLFLLPTKAGPVSWRRQMLKKLWRYKETQEDEEQPATEGVFIGGEDDASLPFFGIMEISNQALLDTPEHRYIVQVTMKDEKPFITTSVYTTLGQLVKEHKSTSWIVFYSQLCGEYQDFQINNDWYIYEEAIN